MEHFGYLFATYSIIFVAMFLYVAFIWQRQSRLESEVRALEAKLKALTEPRSESGGAESGSKPSP
ncbi:MAG TPA: CcmD family protein [Acidimicrobiales bacterium]|nr:CcmD family protein [Acidimicrobiales bacterium]HYB89737.1 CcmD family protein [Candidatus Binataceae bacterium]